MSSSGAGPLEQRLEHQSINSQHIIEVNEEGQERMKRRKKSRREANEKAANEIE